MRAADTNVLVRYIACDDPKQEAIVERLFRECLTKNEPIFVPVLVICELIWVLDRTFGQTKAQIIQTLEELLAISFLRFEQEGIIRLCLDRYRGGKASFPDYVIGAIAAEAGCRDTVSFDRDLKGAEGFTIL